MSHHPTDRARTLGSCPTLSLVTVLASDSEGERAPTEAERVEDDTGEGGTGAATTELVGVPADLPRRAEAPPRGVLVITDREGNPSSERKRVAKVESSNAHLYYRDKCT